MSDASIKVKKRTVHRSTGLTGDGLYYVVEREGNGWIAISRGYPHSTSAYANLGRVTAAETRKAEGDVV